MEDIALDNHDQLEAFLMRVEKRAYRMAMLTTGNTDDALDIVQDAMMGLVQKYAHKPAVEWQPLFYRVLNSRIMDWCRRSKVRNRWRLWLRGQENDTQPDLVESAMDTHTPDPLTRMQYDDMTDMLLVALQALPPRQRQAFLLRCWEGMDVAETARVMGCSQGSVKTHYSRARESLRERLEDYRP